MGAQLGKDILLKLDETGAGPFVTVAGLRSNRISMNAETVDITTADSTGRWRELLTGAGVRSVAVSGSGIFKDAASDAAMRRVFFDGTAPEFELVIPDFGVLRGAFQITALEFAGTHDGEATFEIAFTSTGVIEFIED